MGGLRMVDAGGARLACRVAGPEAAPPVVLLHALGEDGQTWAETAGRLAARHRVFAPDLRGTRGERAVPGVLLRAHA